MDEIISSQKPYYDKSGLGYKQIHTEKGSNSMITEKEAKQRSYAKVIRGPIKKEECKPSKENSREIERTQEDDYKRMTPSRRSKILNQQPTMERRRL